MAYSRVLQARKNLKDKNGINQEREGASEFPSLLFKGPPIGDWE